MASFNLSVALKFLKIYATVGLISSLIVHILSLLLSVIDLNSFGVVLSCLQLGIILLSLFIWYINRQMKYGNSDRDTYLEQRESDSTWKITSSQCPKWMKFIIQASNIYTLLFWWLGFILVAIHQMPFETWAVRCFSTILMLMYLRCLALVIACYRRYQIF
ncbi:hypothetical protein [Aulosira sp. FACHB-615]|uniref:hypothetical protein n=1 Tax=Aulosira sp. FACHB-615 TaxID=2692777 RepID=UPI00168852AA|nr:hypothetical protein [Aulosira sp. FACHB-615]MBD2491518.1 hypothetical protein [Aulosira sp. FACHB-615]